MISCISGPHVRSHVSINKLLGSTLGFRFSNERLTRPRHSGHLSAVVYLMNITALFPYPNLEIRQLLRVSAALRRQQLVAI